MYYCPTTIRYDSPRYGKRVTVPIGFESDGATGAVDIYTEAWWIHDMLCVRGAWDDGTPVTALQAAMVLRDILKRDGRWVRAITWPVATYLFGCKRARANGLT